VIPAIVKKPALAVAVLIIAGLTLSPEVFYPWKETYIGALDAQAWPGLVLAPSGGCAYAFLLRIERNEETVEGADFYYLVCEVGPHSPDGLYARVRFDLGLPFRMGAETPILMKPPPRRQVLTLEWSRRDERTVIGRLVCPEDIRVTVVHYAPWDTAPEYEVLQDGQVRGRSGRDGDPAYLMWVSGPGEPAVAAPRSIARTYLPGSDRTIAFVAGIGEGTEALISRLTRYRNAVSISDLIDEEARVYEEKRVKVRGLYAGVAESVTNSLHWGVLYQPGNHRFYMPASRTSLFTRSNNRPDPWTIRGESAFLDALAVGLESRKLAMDALAAVFETQYPNGNIPGWRSRSSGSADRSQPPLGAYVALKLFGRLGDLQILQQAYPHLQRWHAFWTEPRTNGTPRRDGNRDGLLEWGTDTALIGRDVPSWERNASGRMRAGWESGQDDLPNWDDATFNEATGTLSMNCLDLNALYALDAWSLAEIAAVLGRAADAESYRDQYEAMKKLINDRLWNEKEGFYFDRHWDGRFSVHKAASAFYTLLAGIPDQERVRRMLKRLLDPREYWGDYVIPSVSRDDPSFRPESQQSWRGAVRPAANYLVYQGLKAYRQDAVASEFARKSAEMSMRSWTSFGLSPESFDSLTGEAGGQRFHGGGPLAALVAVEECLDFTPHEGFRFGILQPEAKARMSRVLIQGRQYEVGTSNSETFLREEGEVLIVIDGGAVVRRFLYNEAEVSFDINTLKKRDIRVHLLKKGKYQILIDGRAADVFSARSRKFSVPEGEHSVLIQLLEDLEKDRPEEAPASKPAKE
jgi:hypothetical protein